MWLDILSEVFLARMSAVEQKNLALETLRKLLNDQVRFTEQKNIVLSRQFREALEDGIEYSEPDARARDSLARASGSNKLRVSIAGELARKLAGAEALAARIREELAAIEALPEALLRRAFGGGL